MKWSETNSWKSTTWKGRKNGIKFDIEECHEGFSNTITGYYAFCKHIKENIVLNSLWILPEFNTLENAQMWCEELKIDKLKELRDSGIDKRKENK